MDVIVLAGGQSSRMGHNKLRAPVGGVALLDRVLLAVRDAQRVVVVGQPVPTVYPVSWTIEQPAGAGPLAGIGAGLAYLDSQQPPVQDSDRVLVIAGDLPLAEQAIDALQKSSAEESVVVATDDEGHQQVLLSLWPTMLLRDQLQRAEPLANRPARLLLKDCVAQTVEVGRAATDVDTPEDLAAIQKLIP